jgi:hypothetical protein
MRIPSYPPFFRLFFLMRTRYPPFLDFFLKKNEDPQLPPPFLDFFIK